MTQVIDERVVEMKFDNKDFEKNVAESMSTLEKLKNALNFDSAKSLENLGKATKGFDMSGVANQIQEAANKFSVLEIAGITAIAKITSAAMDMGTKLVKSLSVDQISTGFNKYAEKTTAVQTIMAATAKQFLSQSEQMEVINSQLQKLMWFTDETSYNFVDMVGNIGKFTSNNIGLEESATAMQGIANWAAISGQNAQTASRAMYNIAQAMGTGVMKQKDWMSIENANMATAQFKETAIETAAALGKLRKVSDGVYETLDGKGTVTVESFREELKKGWFDKDVMMETFAVYGRFTDELYKLSEVTGKTATDLLQDAEDFKKGDLDIQKLAQDTGVSVEELTEAFEKLNSVQNETGQQAFRNAQEAKTFLEVIDALKDAVSSKWSESFELIFGDYLEAKKLWTGLVNDLYNVFAAGGDERNEILGFWKELGGREDLIKGLINAVNLLVKPIQAVFRAWKSMFPDTEKMGSILADLTKRFEEFTAKIQPSEEVLTDIYLIFKSIFTVGKLVSKIFIDIIHAIFPVTAPMRSLLEMIIHVVATISAYVTVISEFIIENGLVVSIVEVVAAAFKGFLTVLKNVVKILGGGILAAIGGVVYVFASVGTKISQFVKQAQPLQKLLNFLTKTFSKISGLLSKIGKSTDKTTTVTKKMTKYFGAASESVAEYGTITKDSEKKTTKFGSALEKIGKVVKTVATVIVGAAILVGNGIKTLATTIINFFKNIGTHINNAKDGVSGIVDVIKGVFANIGEMLATAKEKFIEFLQALGINTDEVQAGFKTLKDGIASFISTITPGKIIAIAFAASLLGIAGAAVKLSSTLTDTLGAAKGLFYNINKIINKQFAKATVFTDVAKGIALIAASIALLTLVDQAKLRNVADIMLKLTATAGAFAVVLTLLSGMFAKKNLVEGFQTNITMMIAMAGAMLVLSLALAALSKVTITGGFKDWANKLGIMLAMLLEVAGVAILVSKVSPQLAKGSLLLLAIAAALKYIASAMVDISKIQVPEFANNIGQFGAVFAGIGVIIYAAGNLKLTSALSILLVAKAIQKILPEIIAILKMFTAAKFDEMAGNIEKHIKGAYAMEGALVAIASVIYAIGNLGKLFLGIGAAALGIGVGLRLIVNSIKGIEELMRVMTPAQIQQAINIILGFITVFTVVILLIRAVDATMQIIAKINKVDLLPVKFAAIGVAMLALATSMMLMVAALDILSNIKAETAKLWGLVGMLSVLTIAFGAAIALAGIGARGKGTVAAIITMVIALVVLVAELAILSMMVDADPGGILMSLGILMAIFAGLGGIFVAAGTIGYKKTGPILAILGAITLITGIIVAISTLGKDVDMKKGALTVSAAAGIITLLTWLMSRTISSSHMTKAQIKNVMGVFIDLVIALATFTGEIMLLSAIPTGKLIAAGAVLAGLGGVLVHLTRIIVERIAAVNVTKAKINNVLTVYSFVVGSLLLLGGELIAFSIVADPVKLGVATGCLAAMALVIGLLNNSIIKKLDSANLTKAKVKSVIAVLVATVGSLLLIGGELIAFSIVADPKKLAVATLCLGSMAVVIGALTSLLIFVTSKFKLSWMDVLKTLSIMLGVVAEVALVGYALYKLSELDMGKLSQAVTAINSIMAVANVFAMLITAIVGFFGSTGVGAVAIWAVPVIIVSLGAAVLECAGAIALAAYGFEIFAKALGTLGESLNYFQEKGIDLKYFAEGFGALAWSLAGMAIGGTLGGIGILVLAAGIAALANALTAEFVTNIDNLSKVDLLGIAGGIAAIGLAGVLCTVGAPGIIVLAAAISLLSTNLDGAKGKLKDFWKDVESTFTLGKASGASKAAYEAGILIGGSKHPNKGFIGGIAEATTWGSELPLIYNTFMNDVSNSFLNNGIAVAGAGKSGTQVGKSWLTKLLAAVGDPGAQLMQQYGDLSNAEVLSDGTIATPTTMAAANSEGSILGGEIASGAIETFATQFTSYLSTFLNGLNIDFSGMFGNLTVYKETNQAILKGSEIVKDYGLEMDKATTKTQNYRRAGMELTTQVGLYGKESKKVIDIQATLNNGLEEAKDAVKDLGVDAKNYIPDVSEVIQDATDSITENLGGVSDAAEKASGKTGKAVKDLIDGIKSSIENLDFFSKFEMKTEMTAETLLENMRSNLDGVASWTHKLTVLVTRGIDQGILEKLYEMGPQGYETVNAFTQMTAEQLAEANQIWQTKLALPDKVGDILGSALKQCGNSAVEGWTGALKEHIGEHEAIYGYFDDQIKFVKEDMLEINSPSHVFERFGVGCIEGLIKGLTDEFMMARMKVNIRAVVCFNIIDEFTTDLNPEIFAEIGRNILDGLLAGLSDEGLIGAIVSQVEYVCSLIEPASEKVLDINSPSKVMRRVGNFVGEGLVLGIMDGAENVESAARQVAEGIITGVDDTSSQIQNLLNSDLDLNPIITPMLDLSYMRAQLAEANAMFNAQKAYLYGSQNGAYPNGYTSPQINYTQNNYSPKALSRIDIYRDTRNQLSTLKGLVTANG